jgi:hypothetical protein
VEHVVHLGACAVVILSGRDDQRGFMTNDP